MIWLRKLVVLFLLGFVLVGCSGSSEDSKATSSTPPPPPVQTTSAEDKARQEQADKDLKAEWARQDAERQGRIDALDTKVKKEKTLDGKLRVIVTEACLFDAAADKKRESSEGHAPHQTDYDELYKKYWQATGQRQFPLTREMERYCPVSPVAGG